MKKRSSTVKRNRSRSVMVRALGSGSSRFKARAARKARSTKRALTVRRARSARMTTNHGEIRRWVEARGGSPAVVKRTARGKAADGVLRVDFPGFGGAQSLKAVPWNEWFRVFDNRRLAFLYQERTAGGKPSRFNKLVCRK